MKYHCLIIRFTCKEKAKTVFKTLVTTFLWGYGEKGNLTFTLQMGSNQVQPLWNNLSMFRIFENGCPCIREDIYGTIHCNNSWNKKVRTSCVYTENG